MAERPADPPLRLRLYIAGETPNSMLALSNLRDLLEGRAHQLEIVDVLKEPERALDEGVYVTPTLVRVSPEPNRSVIGSLSPQNGVSSVLLGA
jgi:circadian clock protein KaiB